MSNENNINNWFYLIDVNEINKEDNAFSNLIKDHIEEIRLKYSISSGKSDDIVLNSEWWKIKPTDYTDRFKIPSTPYTVPTPFFDPPWNKDSNYWFKKYIEELHKNNNVEKTDKSPDVPKEENGVNNCASAEYIKPRKFNIGDVVYLNSCPEMRWTIESFEKLMDIEMVKCIGFIPETSVLQQHFFHEDTLTKV